MKNKIKRFLCALIPLIVLGSEMGLTIWSYATTGAVSLEIKTYVCGVTAGLVWGMALALQERYEEEDENK